MKRLYFSILLLFAIASMTAQDTREYLSQPTNGHYIFTNPTNGDSINCYADQILRGDIYDNRYVLGGTLFGETDIEKELFKVINNHDVIFDYGMQVGDTLNVAMNYIAPTCYGNNSFYCLWYKHIEVQSIDTIAHNGIERLRYHLKSRFHCADVEYGYTTPETERPREEDYFEKFNRSYDGEYFEEQWIEGIGYTVYWINMILFSPFIEEYADHVELGILQCAFDGAENIYIAEGANCDGLSDNPNHKIDFTTLTLHRSGDVLVAVFPTAGAGEAITLYDATGRVVAVQPIRKGATTASINVANLPKGVYIAHLNSGASEKVAL